MDLGINLSGFIYSWSNDPGFMTTVKSEIDYFSAKGMTTIRLPLAWEQLQPGLNGALDAAYLATIRETVAYAARNGLDVILDLHNFGQYGQDLVGSSAVPIAAFADLWGKLAGAFAQDGNVVFGLMNEPQVASATAWLPAVNAAIAAIRGAGATTQQVLVPGVHWDGAWNWTATDNASVLGAPGAVVDPAGNFAFEVHQYLDDTSGQHDWVVSPTIGAERLSAITAWAQQNGYKLYLGEFGVADNPTALTALDTMLAYMEAHGDVWQGGSYWAAGQGWTNYMFSVEPDLGILDRPQMDVLERHTGARTVDTRLADGTHRIDTFVGATATVSDHVDGAGRLLSRSLYDGATGAIEKTIVLRADGTSTLSTYGPTGTPTQVTVQDAAFHLLQKTSIAADGSQTIAFYPGGQHDAARVEYYDLHGAMTSSVDNLSDGTHVTNDYVAGRLAAASTFDDHWAFASRIRYDALGHATERQWVDPLGQNAIDVYDPTGSYVATRTVFSAAWQALTQSAFDAAGHMTSLSQVLADGTHQLDSLSSLGTVTSRAIYTAAGQLITRDLAPIILSDGGQANAALSVAENTKLVTTVHASDADGPAATYSIVGGADAARFQIGSSSGALSFRAAPDYENPTDAGHANVYHVVVRASDGILGADQTLAVHVTDVVEAASPVVGVALPAVAPVLAGPALTAAPYPAAAPAQEHLNPVFRFYDTTTGHHFYTTSAAEKAGILAHQPSFQFEGVAWATPDKSAATVDVFRFFDTKTGDHFFTPSTVERDTILKTLPSYQFEGVAFQAYASTGGEGRFSLERFFNTKTAVHHFAGSADETAGINAGAAGANWIDEGPGFVVHAPTAGMLHL